MSKPFENYLPFKNSEKKPVHAGISYGDSVKYYKHTKGKNWLQMLKKVSFKGSKY